MDLTAIEHDGLITTADALRVGITHRDLVREVAAGQLFRIRRGTYVRMPVWDAAPERERHLLRVRAVVVAAHHPVTLARESSAAVWGVPLDAFPDDVVVIDRWRGGGRSEPGVRRTARGASTASTVEVDGYSCTNLVRTIVDVACTMDFPRAVALIDWAISTRNPQPIELASIASDARVRRCPLTVWRAIEFGSPHSGSMGESEARAVIHALGFPAPQLQRRFVDQKGSMYSDFFWEQFSAAGEFDGKVKYTRNEYTQGDPSEVVWREKQREDRLRRQVRTVVRIVTSDVRQPWLLRAMLLEAGIHPIPRGGRHHSAAGLATPAARQYLPPRRPDLPPNRLDLPPNRPDLPPRAISSRHGAPAKHRR